MSEPAQMLRHFGGRYCLAFANSVLWRRSATPEDLAVDYAGLLAQVARVDGLPAAERAELAATAAARPGEAAAAHAAAVELRELLFRVLSAAAARTPPAGSDLSAFNEAVA